MAQVSVQNLRKSFGPVDVIHGVDVDISDGEFVVLVGPSGCGKSTLLRMIAGLEGITEGTIKIGETIVNNLPPSERDIAMVFQSYALYPHMSVRDNMGFSLKTAGAPKEEIVSKVGRAANILKLNDYLDRRPKDLSGGQRQRISIARALLKDAPILIMDEPTSALDAETEAQLLAALRTLMHNRTTIIIAHRLSTIRHAERIAFLDEGRVVESGAHDELIRNNGPYARFYSMQLGEEST